MAAPLSPDRLLSALRAEGVDVREYKSWRTHNRDGETGRTFGPVHGVVIHHTAGRDSLALCYNGTSSLPGPLCHTHLSKAGVASMLSAGRANHAGSFAANAHAAVLAEASVHPRPDAAEPVDANDCYYGIEIENLGDGKDPYPTVQYDAAVRWAAAICRAHGWSADSVIGHKEGTRRKIDPSFSMEVFRAAVAERLKHPASWNPNDPEEDDMTLSKADVNTFATVDGVFKAPSDAADYSADPESSDHYWSFGSHVNDNTTRIRRIDKTAAALTAQLAALTAAVGALAAGGGLDAAEIQAAAEAGAQAALDRLGDALTTEA